ncbi:MAG: sulfatase-like hydrolase/transferase [Tannerellaceae bacterium]|jgi:phosphoglycerol transferase MdoB-like AlkP superfamily enzyme|nr:sulfatase-like hydrolase/transferase [Tannerellaceae bacterium]
MKKRVLFILAVFVAWLPLLAVQKLVFMFYHKSLADGCTLMDWARVVFHGLKLDCTISGYLTAIPLLCTLVSVWLPGKYLHRIIRVYFGVMAVFVAAIFALDVALYAFWGFRIDATVFFYMQSTSDAIAGIPTGLLVQQIIVFIVYALGIYWVFNRFVVPLLPDLPAKKRLLSTIVCLIAGGILFIPVRGGVTTSTANVGMVYFSNNQFLNHSAINPVFSLMVSLSKQQDFASQFNFFEETKRQQLFEALVAPTPYPVANDSVVAGLLNTKRPDILLIILESFSANVVETTGGEKGVTPSLNRFSKEGVLFTNFYANSFRTDRGLVSVLNGYLAQPTTSIMKYPPKSQTLPSISKSLIKEGYTADMLYGGDINFTNMQSYFYSSGYSYIVADRDFPLSSRLSKWGANDNITFDYLFHSLADNKRKSPWFSTFLTLSSHEPFEVPYHRLDNPYLNSVAFTDSCIGDFIDRIKQLPVWENLLVILVSDHGFRYPENLQEYDPARYHIPMLWIGGAVKEPKLIDTIANQTDLAATLLCQLGIPHQEFVFSKNLFSPDYPRYAYYTFHNGFGFIDNTGLSVYDNESGKPLIETPAEGSNLRLDKGKALLQTLYDDLGNR